MNVKIGELPEGVTADGQKVVRRGLIALKDFAAGETIYSETPIISGLEPALEGGEFCHYCMKQIVGEESKVPCSTCTKVVFCSETCEKSAATEFHTVLCTKDNEDASSPERALFDYSKDSNRKYPEMLAKFLAKMVHEETLNTGEEYNLFDHIERLRYLEIRPSEAEEKEIALLKAALGAKIPGIEEFINEERYLTLKGKLLYNAYGLSTSLDNERVVEVNMIPLCMGAICVLDRYGIVNISSTSFNVYFLAFPREQSQRARWSFGRCWILQSDLLHVALVRAQHQGCLCRARQQAFDCCRPRCQGWR